MNLILGLPQQRAMMNTYSSIIASVVATFAVSALSNKEGKLHIDHIQNAVLAGGVSIGEDLQGVPKKRVICV